MPSSGKYTMRLRARGRRSTPPMSPSRALLFHIEFPGHTMIVYCGAVFITETTGSVLQVYAISNFFCNARAIEV